MHIARMLLPARAGSAGHAAPGAFTDPAAFAASVPRGTASVDFDSRS